MKKMASSPWLMLLACTACVQQQDGPLLIATVQNVTRQSTTPTAEGTVAIVDSGAARIVSSWGIHTVPTDTAAADVALDADARTLTVLAEDRHTLTHFAIRQLYPFAYETLGTNHSKDEIGAIAYTMDGTLLTTNHSLIVPSTYRHTALIDGVLEVPTSTCQCQQEGHYQQHQKASCAQAPPGTYLQGVFLRQCPPGTYNPDRGATTPFACRPCPPNQCAPTEGTALCTACSNTKRTQCHLNSQCPNAAGECIDMKPTEPIVSTIATIPPLVTAAFHTHIAVGNTVNNNNNTLPTGKKIVALQQYGENILLALEQTDRQVWLLLLLGNPPPYLFLDTPQNLIGQPTTMLYHQDSSLYIADQQGFLLAGRRWRYNTSRPVTALAHVPHLQLIAALLENSQQIHLVQQDTMQLQSIQYAPAAATSIAYWQGGILAAHDHQITQVWPAHNHIQIGQADIPGHTASRLTYPTALSASNQTLYFIETTTGYLRQAELINSCMCPQDFYLAEAQCLPCPQGTHAMAGSTACTPHCPAGQTFNNTACTKCTPASQGCTHIHQPFDQQQQWYTWDEIKDTTYYANDFISRYSLQQSYLHDAQAKTAFWQQADFRFLESQVTFWYPLLQQQGSPPPQYCIVQDKVRAYTPDLCQAVLLQCYCNLQLQLLPQTQPMLLLAPLAAQQAVILAQVITYTPCTQTLTPLQEFAQGPDPTLCYFACRYGTAAPAAQQYYLGLYMDATASLLLVHDLPQNTFPLTRFPTKQLQAAAQAACSTCPIAPCTEVGTYRRPFSPHTTCGTPCYMNCTAACQDTCTWPENAHPTGPGTSYPTSCPWQCNLGFFRPNPYQCQRCHASACDGQIYIGNNLCLPTTQSPCRPCRAYPNTTLRVLDNAKCEYSCNHNGTYFSIEKEGCVQCPANLTCPPGYSRNCNRCIPCDVAETSSSIRLLPTATPQCMATCQDRYMPHIQGRPMPLNSAWPIQDLTCKPCTTCVVNTNTTQCDRKCPLGYYADCRYPECIQCPPTPNTIFIPAAAECATACVNNMVMRITPPALLPTCVQCPTNYYAVWNATPGKRWWWTTPQTQNVRRAGICWPCPPGTTTLQGAADLCQDPQAQTLLQV